MISRLSVQRRSGHHIFVTRALIVLVLIALGCQGEDGSGGNGEGNLGAPDDVGMLDTPTNVVSTTDRGPGGTQFDSSEFRVEGAVTMLFSTSFNPGDRISFLESVTEEGRDVIFAFDYRTGLIRELFAIPGGSGTFVGPPPLMLDGPRLYTSTSRTDAEQVTVIEIDLASGERLTESAVPSYWGSCQAVASGDYYFDWIDDLFVARGVTASGPVDDLTAIANADEFCPSAGFGSLDGSLVVLDAPTERDPDVDTIELWAVNAGARESTPLVSIATAVVSLGTEGERVPVVTIGEDGLYVLASDFVSIEIWFVPYERRPGSPAGSSESQSPTLITRIEIPFLSQVVPFEDSVVSIEEIRGLGVVDGLLAIPIGLLEAQRFRWGALVVLDPQSNTVDLLRVADLPRTFAMVRTPATP